MYSVESVNISAEKVAAEQNFVTLHRFQVRCMEHGGASSEAASGQKCKALPCFERFADVEEVFTRVLNAVAGASYPGGRELESAVNRGLSHAAPKYSPFKMPGVNSIKLLTGEGRGREQNRAVS